MARRYSTTPAEIVGLHPRSWEGLIVTVATHHAGRAADASDRGAIEGGCMPVVMIGGAL